MVGAHEDNNPQHTWNKRPMQNNENDATKMKLSFIIPYHNEPRPMLIQCLDSINDIGCAGIGCEIIVVDDGSSINLSSVLTNRYPRLRYLRHETSRGLSAARNTGIDAAQSEYIQFVDSDDYLLPAIYSSCIDTLMRKQCDILIFGERHKVKDICTGAEYMLQHNLRAAAWGYVFKRSVLGGLRFTEGILHEDEEFTPLLLLNCNNVAATDANPYFYRQRTGSITNTNNKEWIERRLNDTEAVIQRLATHLPQLSQSQCAALARRISQLSMDYIYQTIRLTRSITHTRKRSNRLRSLGLYPLPLRCYTWKYWLFSLATHLF